MTENPYETGQPAIEATEAVAKSGCGKFIIAGCVVLGILGLLVLFLLPAFRRSPEPAYRYFGKKNLDDIGAAMHNYHDKHGHFPPAFTTDNNGNRLHSWRTLLLPFLDQAALYETIDLNKPWDHPDNARARDTKLEIFHCRSANLKPSYTNYKAIIGDHAFFSPDGEPRKRGDIIDGLSATIMFAEVAADEAVQWMNPNEDDSAREFLIERLNQASAPHPGGLNAAFADRSSKFISHNAPTPSIEAIITIDGKDHAEVD